MPNRLAAASSPYLLQHAENPVDWFEWGDDAFAEAKRRDVPLLLSVGYSACHWCHVMAHESFEDEDTAAYMNDRFVNVKVDREERPDVDRIYMDAVQAMMGRGGWPMTVFLDHTGRPFFAGTYFPKHDRSGHPSFRRVLEAIDDAWRHRRDELSSQAERLARAVAAGIPSGDAVPDRTVLYGAVATMEREFDDVHGGFGGAPKFPQAPNLEFLLRMLVLDPGLERREEVTALLVKTLDEMRRGGIYDQLGGGFARYSVDRRWLVPHFEKMLYDNAQLARVYLRAWQVTGAERFKVVAVETLDYLLRDMADERGGIYSAEDADSEGEEGKFYVWGWDEFRAVLGDDAPRAAELYGVSPGGTFEGANILHLPVEPADAAENLGMAPGEFAAFRRSVDDRLKTARDLRERPGLDDKVVAAWNGLALRAFAEAGAVLDSRRYLDAGRAIARHLHTHLTRPDGRLLRSGRAGRATVPAFCDDYASVAVGLYTLYAATGETEWYRHADRLVDDMIRLFADDVGAGFFATGSDAERLIARPKNVMDNPTPSDNALAAEALLIKAAYTGDGAIRARLDGTLRLVGNLAARYPTAVPHMLSVLAVSTFGLHEVAVVGAAADRRPLERVVWEQFRPDCVLATGDGRPSDIPLLEGRAPSGDGAVAYVCRDFVCALPDATPEALRASLSPPIGPAD